MVFQRDPVDRRATLPTLDEFGVLRHGPIWVALSPIEARLIAAFLGCPGEVVSRDTLERAGWPDAVAGVRSVDARIKALRKRVAPLAVIIHTVRGHGYLAEFSAPNS
jgi:DNA-binding response OmpR family regulator